MLSAVQIKYGFTAPWGIPKERNFSHGHPLAVAETFLLAEILRSPIDISHRLRLLSHGGSPLP
ncbi:hypothetical protein [[Phormidium] sp. ETS-05]|uniref:hypothetical protein n=1 Tax=[Phormidium] sp. ETS-05 TaxID=222819 RepID=UPI0018EEDFA7|nr:hypothetical protein [[Phormidium] sp. ETS-05]